MVVVMVVVNVVISVSVVPNPLTAFSPPRPATARLEPAETQIEIQQLSTLPSHFTLHCPAPGWCNISWSQVVLD